MTEQRLENASIIEKGLKYIDDAIAEDKNTKLILWNTIEKVLNRPNDTFERMETIIDRVFQEPAGRAIELILSQGEDEVASYSLKNKSFYLSLNQSFRFDYIASVRMFNHSPLSLTKLEILGGEVETLRILRADREYFDLNIDDVSVSYFTEFLIKLMSPKVIDVEDSFVVEFLESIKAQVDSALSEIHE